MSEWRETSNGNHVYEIDTGEHMTVFEKNGRWFGVYDHRFTEEGFKEPEEAMAHMEKAVLLRNLDLLSCKRSEATGWRRTRTGGYHRRHKGGAFTVKQAKSNKWYLVIGQAVLKDHWFDTAQAAMRHGDLL